MSTYALEQWASPPPMAIDINKTYVATIKLAHGDIVIELLGWDAPFTVNNFVFLAGRGFYDGTTFHRVGTGIAQAGDPTGTGKGGPGYTISDESRSLPIDEGMVAMANAGEPHTSGSQFFIARETRHQLNGHYNVFGRVIEGMDIVHAIRNRDQVSTNEVLPPGDEIISVRVRS